jgi:hypothetical protein
LPKTLFGVKGKTFIPSFGVSTKVSRSGTSFPSSSFEGMGVNA